MCQKDNFVNISRKTGITEEDIEKIINILERKNKK
jgi:CRISPR/Cas system type I-B associated protein Csh2 (Cas7 group RAMP superfamily)